MSQIFDVFLSHSGSQKAFTEALYVKLCDHNYNVFFDRESLLKGDHLGVKIFEAIKNCKSAVVVLSEEFITSFWPMMELEHLWRRSKIDNAFKIYPVFFGIQPTILTDKAKLKKWREEKWLDFIEKNHNFDITFWPSALKRVKSHVGSLITKDKINDWWGYIKEVVEKIREQVSPSLPYFPVNSIVCGIKGRERMQEEIDQHFESISHKDGYMQPMLARALLLGVHGIGGVGKTTLCKTMVDYYNNRNVLGISWWLELPSEKGDTKTILDSLKVLLRRLRGTNVDDINDLNQAITELVSKITNLKVFLAIDNVWEWSIEYVVDIIKGGANMSRFMVTSRSQSILQSIFDSALKLERHYYMMIPMPSLKEEEAFEVLCDIRNMNDDDKLKLNDIVKCCFFSDQCHPLLLKAICNMLRRVDSIDDVPIPTYGKYSSTSDDKLEKDVINVLSTSFNYLDEDLQTFFMDAIFLFHAHRDRCIYKDMKMFYPNDSESTFKRKLKDLEFYGMWEVKNEESYIFYGMWEVKNEESYISVIVHDLYLELAKEKASTGKSLYFDGKFELRDTNDISDVQITLKKIMYRSEIREDYSLDLEFDEIKDLVEKSKLEWLKISHVDKIWWDKICSGNLRLTNFKFISTKLLVLILGGGSYNNNIESIDGLESAPNLVSLYLGEFHRLLKVEGISQLTKLQLLEIFCCCSLAPPNLKSCSKLKNLRYVDSSQLKRFAELALPPSLQKLSLELCGQLTDLNGIDSLRNLQHLEIRECKNLVKFPMANIPLKNLQVLMITHCPNILPLPDMLFNSDFLRAVEIHLNKNMKRKFPCGDGEEHLFYDGLQKLLPAQAEVGDYPIGDFPSLQRLKHLQVLKLERSSHTKLFLENCNAAAKDQTIVELLHHLKKLESLELEGITSLKGFPELGCLEDLKLTNCTSLTSLSDLPQLESLKWLDVSSCPSLKQLPNPYRIPKLSRLLIHFNTFAQQLHELNNDSLHLCLHVPIVVSSDASGESINMHFPDVVPDHSYYTWVIYFDLIIRNCASLQWLWSFLSKLNRVHNGASYLKLSICDCTSLPELPSLAKLDCLRQLSILDCTSLQYLPKLLFSNLWNLHALKITGCTSLQYISDLSNLTSLTQLYIGHCTALKNLQDWSNLTELCSLILEGLTSLEKLPHNLSEMEYLHKLSIRQCIALKELPDLSNLEELHSLTLEGLTSLETLQRLPHNLSEMKISDCTCLQELPDIPHGIKCLTLEGLPYLKKVPHNLSNLQHLYELSICRCTVLEELPDLSNLPRLKSVKLERLTSLGKLPHNIFEVKYLQELSICQCIALKELPDLTNLPLLKSIKLERLTSLEKLPHSISKVKYLQELSICQCTALKELPDLSNLEELHSLTLEGLTSLETLQRLPRNLSEMKISDCTCLQELPDIPHGIKCLTLEGLPYLKKVPHNLPNLQHLYELSICRCTALKDLQNDMVVFTNVRKVNFT